MNDSPYRAPALSTPEVTHCLFCGEERRPDGACKKCLAWSGASPVDDTPDAGFACPRCKTTYLRVEAMGRAKVKVCDGCHGVFVPAFQFSILVNDYIADQPLPLGSLPPPPPSFSGASDPKIDLVTCVACRREMDRLQFAARSGAVIDVCNMHGIWLDGGELVAVLHFVKTRAELGDVPLSDQEKVDLAVLEHERIDSEARLSRINYLADLAWWSNRPPKFFGGGD